MHLGLIMDGNRRWAVREQKSIAAGYLAGMDALIRTLNWAISRNVVVVTVFGFSRENWKRPAAELDVLFAIAVAFNLGYAKRFRAMGVRIRVMGALDALPAHSRLALRNLESATRSGNNLQLNLAVNYSGRSDIVNAVRALAARVERHELEPADIDDETLARALAFHEFHDPDIILRTGDESRLSNFMLYECAESELVFVEALWPEMCEAVLDRALGAAIERLVAPLPRAADGAAMSGRPQRRSGKPTSSYP